MSVPARKPLSKKTRFEVFKRDGFKCQYCGAHPPNVLLHVDHINPVAKGGGNSMDNLITSCAPCNHGKGARELTDVPASLADRAMLIREREAQIKGFNDAMQAQELRIEQEGWKIARTLTQDNDLATFKTADMASIKRFLKTLGYWPTHEAAEKAAFKFSRFSSKTFAYFCGICWSKIKEASNG